MDTKKFDVDFLHNFFCEKTNCKKWSEDDLKVISMDELDYIDKLEEEGIRNPDNISSVYKEFNDGHYELYVNEDSLKEEPFLTTEILFSQLLDFYATIIPFFSNSRGLIEKFSKIKSISDGYNTWFEFSSICMSTRLTQLLFKDADLNFDNPYTDDNYKENIDSLLISIKTSNDFPTDKFSVILYSFGKLANIDPALQEEVKTISQLNKLKFIDISEILDDELGKLTNTLYVLLAKSTTTPPNIALFIKLHKLKTKIINLL